MIDAVRWQTGHDHGLVWSHGAALLDGSLPVSHVVEVWTEFRSGGSLEALLQLIASHAGVDLFSLPAFAIALRVKDGWQLAVRGPFEVQITAEDTISGVGVSTWTERLIGFSDALVLRADEDTDQVWRPLQTGVVPASVVAPGSMTVARPHRVVKSVELSAGPIPKPRRAKNVVDDDLDLTRVRLESTTSSTPDDDILLAPTEAVEPVVPIEPPSENIEETAATLEQRADVNEPSHPVLPRGMASSASATIPPPLSPSSASAAEEPLFISKVPFPVSSGKSESEPDVLGDHDGHTVVADTAAPIGVPMPIAAASSAVNGTLVLGVKCPIGHSNPPERRQCSECGADITAEPQQLPRPSLGVMVLPNGERVDLTMPLVVGRTPRASRVAGDEIPRLVPLSQNHISGNHLAINLEQWNILAVDLGSTNGTFLRRQNQAPVRLGERPEPLIEGDVLDLGHGVHLMLERKR